MHWPPSGSKQTLKQTLAHYQYQYGIGITVYFTVFISKIYYLHNAIVRNMLSEVRILSLIYPYEVSIARNA